MANQEFKIMEELSSLLTPLTDEEKTQLEENIVSAGEVREPVVTWNDRLVDGHNRLEIANKHGIEVPVLEMDFANLNHCKEWLLKNQLGRRNLTPDRMKFYRGELYNLLKGKRGGNKRKKKDPPNLPKGQVDPLVASEEDEQPEESVNAAKEVSNLTGASEKTVKRDGAFVEDFNKIPDAWKTLLEHKGITPTHAEVKKILAVPEIEAPVLIRAIRVGQLSLPEALKGVSGKSSKGNKENSQPLWSNHKKELLKKIGEVVRMTDQLHLLKPYEDKLKEAMNSLKALKKTIDRWGV